MKDIINQGLMEKKRPKPVDQRNRKSHDGVSTKERQGTDSNKLKRLLPARDDGGEARGRGATGDRCGGEDTGGAEKKKGTTSTTCLWRGLTN